MAELGTVYVDVEGDFDKFGKTSQSKFSTIGKAAAGVFAAAFVGVKLFDFGKDAFLAAEEYGSLVAGVNNLVENQQKAMGEQATLTTDHIVKQADALQDLTGVSNEQLLTAQQQLLTFQGLQNEGDGAAAVFDRATLALTDMVASGALSDFNSGAIQMGKALQDPIKGVSALARAGVVFTDEQKDSIKALQESGDLLGAQQVILTELEKVYGGTAAATRDDSKVMANSLQDLKVAFGDAVAPAVTQLVPIIKDTVAPLLKQVAPLFGDLAMAVVSILPPIAELIARFSPLVQKILPPLIDIIVKLLDVFLLLIEPIIDLVLVALDPLIEIIVLLADDLIEALMPAILAVAEVTEALAPLLLLVTDLMKPLFEIVGVLAKILGVVLAEAISVVASWVGKLIEKVKPAIEWLTNLWSNVSDALSDVLPNILAFFTDLPGKILDAIKNAATWLVESGKDLIGGFIQGIKDKAGDIITTIKNFVTDKIPGFIKTALGISSPSKVMMGLGREVGAGMALGISKSAGSVDKAMQSLVKTPSFGGLAFDAVGAGASNTGFTQIFQGPVVGDTQKLAEITMQEAARESRYVNA